MLCLLWKREAFKNVDQQTIFVAGLTTNPGEGIRKTDKLCN